MSQLGPNNNTRHDPADPLAVRKVLHDFWDGLSDAQRNYYSGVSASSRLHLSAIVSTCQRYYDHSLSDVRQALAASYIVTLGNLAIQRFKGELTQPEYLKAVHALYTRASDNSRYAYALFGDMSDLNHLVESTAWQVYWAARGVEYIEFSEFVFLGGGRLQDCIQSKPAMDSTLCSFVCELANTCDAAIRSVVSGPRDSKSAGQEALVHALSELLIEADTLRLAVLLDVEAKCPDYIERRVVMPGLPDSKNAREQWQQCWEFWRQLH